MNLTDWSLPAISLAALVIWLVNLRFAIGRRALARSNPDLRIVSLATLVIVAAAQTWSSLLYAEVIGVEASRWGITIARLALLIGGAAFLWIARFRTEGDQ